MALSIRVQFLAGYSGREWPPSPARLFKALVSAARAGWAVGSRESVDDSLRVLEQQGWVNDTSLPEIAAPRATLRAPRQRRFVPNNSKSWPTERRLNPVKGIDLEPEPLLRWDIEPPSVVWYQWPDAPESLVPIVRDVSRRVASVGKGEDFAVVDASAEPPPADVARWHAVRDAHSAAWLEVPEPGCLAVCDAVFGRSASEVPLSAAGVQSVPYVMGADAPVAAPPVGVLALWSRGKRRSWDARLLRQVVGPIRNLLNDIRGEVVDLLARSPADRATMDALVRRVLLGHDETGQPAPEPHLAVVPIPSVLGPHPDGRVRRVALAGFGCANDPTRRAIVEMAHVLLHGRELKDSGRGTGVVLDTEPDSQWSQAMSRRSRSWVTVTPMVQVAKELTSGEWRRLTMARRSPNDAPAELTRLEERLAARRLELITRSLSQAVADQDARPASVQISAAGPIAGVHLAPHYRVSGYLAETPRFHLRVTFDRPVAGPIAVGRGRHVGFGVLWPSE
ncbi:MAG: type I-U CRISPR-associated protein Cas5/Cas6 [Sandaracinaceae bacterium]|nr:type I-U CRISPR-associated protein Cas5/Cas6 [Sandaracinaceae bacterium]